MMQLAVQDWRVEFSVGDQDVKVLWVRSGYGASRPKKGAAVPAVTLSLHREYMERFGVP
jgi:hypothetical protein